MKSYLLLIWLVAVPRLVATGEEEIFIGEISAKTLGHGIEIALSTSEEGKALISIKQNGVKIDVPDSVLNRIDEIVPESVKVSTHMPNGDGIPGNWLEDHEFIVSFDYGGTKLHGTKDESIEVQTRGRLHIRDKKVAYFEWMVPEGHHKNRWTVYRDDKAYDEDEPPPVVEGMLAPRK